MINVPQAPADKIFGVLSLFNADTRANKVSLVSGVYCDETGIVPVLPSVKAAEAKILETEKSKVYLGIEGDKAYRHNVLSLLLGDTYSSAFDVMQAPGGTGALRLIAEFMQRFLPDSSIWISNPTWPNHVNVFNACQVNVQTYRYFDKPSKTLTFADMMADLQHAKAEDVILVHGCCHNPSGADLTLEQGQQLAELAKAKGCYVFFDSAYIGFARGLQEDVEIVQHFVAQGLPIFAAVSFSKNFGLYNERIGALALLIVDAPLVSNMVSQLKAMARANYSNPPAHGAHIVHTVLSDPALKAMWQQDLAGMNQRLKDLRAAFAKRMTKLTGQDFGYVTRQYGLFSFVNVTPEQAKALRDDHAVYIVESGRINIAGLSQHNMEQVCQGLADVLRI